MPGQRETARLAAGCKKKKNPLWGCRRLAFRFYRPLATRHKRACRFYGAISRIGMTTQRDFCASSATMSYNIIPASWIHGRRWSPMREYRDLWKRLQSSIFGRCIRSHTGGSVMRLSQRLSPRPFRTPGGVREEKREKPSLLLCCHAAGVFLNSDAAGSVALRAVSPPRPIKTAAHSGYCSAASRAGT